MSNMKFIYKNNGVVLQTEYSSEELMNLFNNKNFINLFQSDSSSFFPSFDDIVNNTKSISNNKNRNNSVSFVPTFENNIIFSFLMDIHKHIKLNRKQTAAYLYEISKFKSPDLIFTSNMKNKLNFKIPEHIVKKYKDVEFIDGSLEAIRQLRLKGHKVVLFSDQPNIVKGLLSDKDVDNVMQYMMNVFGQHGIFSIDGFYYTRTDAPQDVYSKPNVGMLKRSQRENGVDYSTGYYVGDTIEDIKMAQKIGATPILVRTGKGKETEKKHFNSFNSKYENVEIYDNLLEFAKNL